MTSLFKKKLKFAIYCENESMCDNISLVLKKMFKNNIIIKLYNDTFELFKELNIARATNKPFDAAIVNSEEELETKIVLQKSNPGIKVFSYVDAKTLQHQADLINK
jgi:hypothetical protein